MKGIIEKNLFKIIVSHVIQNCKRNFPKIFLIFYERNKRPPSVLHNGRWQVKKTGNEVHVLLYKKIAHLSIGVFAMRNVLTLGGVNVTPYIKARGYTWTKNALHTDKTGRTKDGKARVDKITDKLTLNYELGETPVEVLAEMESVLMQQTFQASGYGVGGTFNKEFYCSTFAPKAFVITDDHEIWEGVTFTIIEV